MTTESRARLREPRRCCHPIRIADTPPSPSVLLWEEAHANFSPLAAPVHSPIDSRFFVLRNETDIFIVVGIFDRGEAREQCAEVSFCPEDDGLTRWHYVLDSAGDLRAYPYSSGAEVYSSSFTIPQPTFFKVEDRAGARFYIFGFPAVSLMPLKSHCGFHVATSCRGIYSSWTFCSGNGGQDASSYGRLYLEQPNLIGSIESARWHDGALTLSGTIAGTRSHIRLYDPLARSSIHELRIRDGKWTTVLEAGTLSHAGRHQVEMVSDDISFESISYPLDILPSGENPAPFTLSITNDPPMSLTLGPYTPARLDQEMRLLAEHRVQRMHWIDFDPLLPHWQDSRWISHVPETLSSCDGNLVGAAAAAAHRHGIEVIADVKIFDMGANTFWSPSRGTGTATEIENLPFCVAPEIAARPDLSWQLPSETQTSADLPIRKITIFSEVPFDSVDPEHITLWTSRDNLAYHAYGERFGIRQGQLERPHKTWTAGSLIEEPTSATNWYLELSGLSIDHPYLSVRCSGKPISVRHRGSMLVEAQDANGQLAPVTLATACRGDSYTFWKDWFSWYNRIDPLFLSREWPLANLAMTFQVAPRLSPLLEPADAQSHDIWLAWIERLLASGVDGISIRTYCHHSGVDSYLKYSWGPAVIRKFIETHSRNPSLQGEDDERMRKIRTDCYLDFLKEASARVRARGKRFCLQLESGCELSVQAQSRMQFAIPYAEIIEQQIVDEISLKWFTAYNPWVHENILPRTRRRGIPVHIVSRNLSPFSAFALPQTLPRLVADARAAGLQGYNLYELRDLLRKDVGAPAFHDDVRNALLSCDCA